LNVIRIDVIIDMMDKFSFLVGIHFFIKISGGLKVVVECLCGVLVVQCGCAVLVVNSFYSKFKPVSLRTLIVFVGFVGFVEYLIEEVFLIIYGKAVFLLKILLRKLIDQQEISEL